MEAQAEVETWGFSRVVDLDFAKWKLFHVVIFEEKILGYKC